MTPALVDGFWQWNAECPICEKTWRIVVGWYLQPSKRMAVGFLNDGSHECEQP